MALTKVPSAERLRHLFIMQSKGATSASRTRARNELRQITKDLQRVANSRLRKLAQTDYAYGSVYDTTMQFFEQTGSKSFTLPKDMRANAPQDIGAAGYHYALRVRAFVASPETTISGQKAIERERFATFRYSFPEAAGMSDDELRGFLKFMGNSGMDAYLDVFGGYSGEEVEEILHNYMQGGESERAKMAEIFAQYEQYAKQEELLKAGRIEAIPKDAGIDFATVRKQLSSLYESIEKRRR